MHFVQKERRSTLNAVFGAVAIFLEGHFRNQRMLMLQENSPPVFEYAEGEIDCKHQSLIFRDMPYLTVTSSLSLAGLPKLHIQDELDIWRQRMLADLSHQFRLDEWLNDS